MIAPTGTAAAWFAVGGVLSLAPALGVAGGWILGPLWIGAWIAAVAADALLAPRVAREPGLALPQSLGVGAEIELPLGLPPLTGARRAQWHLDYEGPIEVSAERGECSGDAIAASKVRIRAMRRGRAHLAALHVRWTGPLGLAWRSRIEPLDRELAVLPDLPFVSRAVLALPLGTSGSRRSPFVGDGSEFEALREFQAGHDPRAMDWKATARHRRLMVREYRAERDQQVVLAIDTGRLMREPKGALAGRGDDPTGHDVPLTGLDHAIHGALALARTALAQGDRVGLLAFDAKPRAFLPAARDPAALARITEACAGLAYGAEETNFTLGITELSRRFRRRSFVLVLTDFVDTITAELMVENLSRLAQRHLVVFATFRDALHERFVDRPPERMVDVHRAVVADRLHRDRQEVLQRLRDRGVRCVEVAGRQLVAEVVEHYLRLMRQEKV